MTLKPLKWQQVSRFHFYSLGPSECYIKSTNWWDSIKNNKKRKLLLLPAFLTSLLHDIAIWTWQMSPPYPPCLPAMAMCFYSTSILHSYLTSPNLQTGFLLLWIRSRNMCKYIRRSSIFLLLYSASASWLSPVVMGSLAIDRLLICHSGIILVQVRSRWKLYRIPEVSFNLWVLEYQHW